MNCKKTKGKIRILFLILIVLLLFGGCSKKANNSVEKTELMLGTVCNIKIYDNPKDSTFEKAFSRIRDLEAKFTINKTGSEVDEINNAAGIKAISVSEDTFYNIKEGIRFSSITNGEFDITVGPLVKLWGIGTDSARVPTQEEIDSQKSLINFKDIELDETNRTVMLKRKNMLIDLGGTAKGYIADEVAKVLRENGVNHAIINLGGNVLTINNNTNGKPWRIGVQNPFSEERGTSIGTLDVVNKSVTTSGIYERYIEYQGIKYNHILDVHSGLPVNNEIAGVTIISDKSLDGDGVDTGVLLMGLQKGLEVIKSEKNFEAIFVTKDKDIYITSGLKDKFVLTDESFKLKN